MVTTQEQPSPGTGYHGYSAIQMRHETGNFIEDSVNIERYWELGTSDMEQELRGAALSILFVRYLKIHQRFLLFLFSP